MQKESQYYQSSTLPDREKPLGLETPLSFELKLLEVAVRGKKDFERTWNEEATIYEQVMFLEILQEINLQEKEGCSKLLLDRARNLVIRMKAYKSLHQRAKVVYRDFLNLRGSRTSTEYSSSHHHEVKNNVSSAEPYENEQSWSSQMPTLDEKFEEVMAMEFPDTEEDDSSISSFRLRRGEEGTPRGLTLRKTPGETSLSSEIVFDEAFAESLSIFKKPTLADEVVSTPYNFTLEELSEIDSKENETEGKVQSLTLANQEVQVLVIDKPPTHSVLNKCFEQKYSKELSRGDDENDNMVTVCEQDSQVQGNIPQKDFKFLLYWVVDTVTYRAKNVVELRSKHNVLIEGKFKKRCRSRRWRNYYGFILDTGVMIYFRKGVFKKVADFRNSTRILQRVAQRSLDIRDVYLASKATSWSLQFDSAKICKVWHKIILKISQKKRNEIHALEDSFVSLSEYI